MTPIEPEDKNPTWYVPQPGSRGFQPQEPGNDWNPYQASWTQSGSAQIQSQAVSALSILSMVSGIVSVPLICLCFLSIPFSLFAIVSGHLSRAICRRSQGRVTGDGMATAGLVLGYVTLLVTIGILATLLTRFSAVPAFVPGRVAPPVVAPPAMTQSDGNVQLDQAIAMVSLRLQTGNSEEAITLAQHLQASLRDISQQLQAGGLPVRDGSTEPNPDEGSSTIAAELPETTDSLALQQAMAQSAVYCALRGDSCAFLVVIQNLTDLDAADRSALSRMIWLAAGRSVKDHAEEGDDFAVALVSNGLLAEISLGHYERSEHFDAGLQYRGEPDDATRRALEGFFEPESAEAMSGAVE